MSVRKNNGNLSETIGNMQPFTEVAIADEVSEKRGEWKHKNLRVYKENRQKFPMLPIVS